MRKFFQLMARYIKGGAELLYLLISMLRLKRFNHKRIVKRGHRWSSVKILANGPSLKKSEDIIKATKDCAFCMLNSAAYTPLFHEIKPSYYFLIDSVLFLDDSLISAFSKADNDKIIEGLKSVDWPMLIFVPSLYIREAEKYHVSPTIELVPLSSVSVKEDFPFNKLKFRFYEKWLATPTSQNVLASAIYCMINLGYERIELYGAEHSWLKQLIVDDDNHVCMVDAHYYDEGKEPPKFVIKYKGRPQRIWEQLRIQAVTFKGYDDLSQYAQFRGNIDIVNKSPGSYIDAFRKEYD